MIGNLLYNDEILGTVSTESFKAFKQVDHRKQDTWFRKTMQRPQKSRHTRTKRGRK